MNFGPLNRLGGERRLNVLISRAKEKVNVFSAIRKSDFDLSKTKSHGVRDFMEYLGYAESGGDEELLDNIPDQGGDYDEDNPFENSVAKQLEKEGIKFKRQVGQSGYKIDFGIIDPEDPSRYILALECDGASYHSSVTARDADRSRQSILEMKGWVFHRIWSTDWFANPDPEMEKLKKSISKACSKAKPASKKKEDLEIEYESKQKVKQPNFPQYHLFKPQKYHTKNSFDTHIRHFNNHTRALYGTNTWSLAARERYSPYISEYILDIVKVESPIHMKEACTRVLKIYRLQMANKKKMEAIRRVVQALHDKEHLVFKDQFLYHKSSHRSRKVDFCRIRAETGPSKDIEHVSPEELEYAIKHILKRDYSIPEENLIQEVVYKLGFKSTGPRMKKHLSKFIKNRIGTLIQKDGKELSLFT